MSASATLYIVPTPIGNLQDISQRALDTLREVDWIAAEDTRHTHKLLQHFAINARTLSLHEHNEDKRAAMLCQRLLDGESVALVSDAGTPLISDPGFILVRKCREEGIVVTALPGPCAAITALSASGLPTDKFVFEGFLPVKMLAREQALENLQKRTATSVFYEAPRRIAETIEVVEKVLGTSRQIVLAKEISKTFETYISGNVEKVRDYLSQDPAHQKGEFVLIIAGCDATPSEIPPEALKLLTLLQTELPLKKAAAIVAQQYDLKKNRLYQIGLEMNEH
ncbi:16S rRNA (cytidine(1402)-2'-O)-methyltransferase [Alteromonas sp. ASW11-130]|uniref:16S rRNA (cytidine(1402)-2'-O)-methyltransferase n=1 Tax=Alteromonas sp. ASW11-130 TaxID=3015775 RepID=UPI002241B5B1|nr:16S rRNA (cytidine(1402)-2'-O)-methyltransferase [Alteromonas sp. ASW11-130]MCW8091792.1 16S rRNA (cytidine(1402)-2'-O)-methyltransferase [Alteromonas sp. ASW11-130]